MKPGHPRRTVVNALFVAIAVAIFMSGQALAATWTDPSTIWSKPAGAEWPDPIGLVTLDNSTLVAAYYLHDTGTFLQRSTDNGLTWGPPIDVSRPKTGYTAVSGAGNSVDLATLTCNNSGCAIGYQRSTDGGLTFSEPINLSDFDATGAPVISRGPDGTVAVVWYSAPLAKIFVRVSHDGGLTFAPRVRLWTVSDYDGSYSVAVTNGVMYAVSGFTSGSIEVRKSTNGTSWHSAVSLGRYDGPGLVGHVQVAAKALRYTSAGTAPHRADICRFTADRRTRARRGSHASASPSRCGTRRRRSCRSTTASSGQHLACGRVRPSTCRRTTARALTASTGRRASSSPRIPRIPLPVRHRLHRPSNRRLLVLRELRLSPSNARQVGVSPSKGMHRV